MLRERSICAFGGGMAPRILVHGGQRAICRPNPASRRGTAFAYGMISALEAARGFRGRFHDAIQ
jgi:hypothetical protein